MIDFYEQCRQRRQRARVKRLLIDLGVLTFVFTMLALVRGPEPVPEQLTLKQQQAVVDRW